MRLRSGGLTSKNGFSVVAPISDERAVLDRRQQGVLLGLVEAVDLVEEQDRALSVLAEALAGPLDDLADVLDAGGHRRQLLERPRRAAGHGEGERRLARARRPHSSTLDEAVLLDQPAQRPARAERGGPGRRPRRSCAGGAGPPAAPAGAAVRPPPR